MSKSAQNKGVWAGINAERHRNAPEICEALLQSGQGIPMEVFDIVEGEFTTEFLPFPVSPEELEELTGSHGFSIFGGGESSERIKAPLDGTMEEWIQQALEVGMGSYPNIHMMHRNLFSQRRKCK